MLPAHLSLSERGFMVLSWQRRAYGDCRDDDGDRRVFRTGRAAWLKEISVREVFPALVSTIFYNFAAS